MPKCEICGEVERGKRQACAICGRLGCSYCGPQSSDVECCVECAKRIRFRVSGAGRRNERNHDTSTYVHGGVLVWGRISRGGEPAREWRNWRTHRAGVSAKFVEDQYHGARHYE